MSASPPSRPPEATGLLVGAGGTGEPTRWALAAEAPLTLLYDGERFGVMMVTPADLEDFAIGFTLNEGIATTPGDIREVRLTRAGADGRIANVILVDGIAEAAKERRRSILAGSACGICGAQTAEAALPRPAKVSGPLPEPATVLAALARLGDVQPMNRENRSTHAAAFFTTSGDLVTGREDIGRHNALDKLAGALARGGHRASDGFVVTSSRLSVEMILKAARMSAPLVAAVSGPSDLALRMAAEAGLAVACLAGDRIVVFGRT